MRREAGARGNGLLRALTSVIRKPQTRDEKGGHKRPGISPLYYRKLIDSTKPDLL